MKNILLILLCIACTLLSNAQTKKVVKTKSGGTKYVFILARTNEPVDDYNPQVQAIASLEHIQSSYYKPQFITYTSDIVEIANCTEDKKYRMLDKFRDRINADIESKNQQRLGYENDLNKETGRAKMLGSYIFQYNTYKEASISREKKREDARGD